MTNVTYQEGLTKRGKSIRFLMRRDSTPDTSIKIPTKWLLCSAVDLFSTSTLNSLDGVRLIKRVGLTKVVSRIPGYIVP